jgi:DNA repair protein SbcC/Rad50
LHQQTQHSIDSQQAYAKSSEALAQTNMLLATHEGEAQACSMRQANWISHYNNNTLNDNAVLDIGQLRVLLSHTTEWIATERNQLQVIDSAVRQAATVLTERHNQRQSHQERCPQQENGTPDNADAAVEIKANPMDALQQEIDAIHTERQKAQTTAAELQIALAQDKARRSSVADILILFDRQEAKSRIWAQLNELIGAADGKKFRNYAQQTTLDVLLGYANSHLHILSRRYRLQRINDSLALMVVDQDMGDELRSVHSLSGGESFLVSLALALGLASLSSNRVRVESLFIDEGFGSLDAETLGVAMDALDGLQSMGRKVGVISHVQEMTERIATKISVHRISGGRSVVTIA